MSAPQASAGGPKMVVDKVLAETDPRCVGAKERLTRAGYPRVDDCSVELIHCGEGGHEWLDNGFCQTYLVLSTGERCRVLDYAPSQKLQPHVHDMDELFVITGGEVTCHRWPEGLKGGARQTTVLSVGDTLSVPCGMPHALSASRVDGVQFHEVIGDFGKRSTRFFSAYNLSKDGDDVIRAKL